MEEIIYYIQNATPAEIDVIMDAVFKRKQILYPDWDIQYLAVPLDDREDRRRTLEFVARCLEEQLRSITVGGGSVTRPQPFREGTA